MSRQNRSNRLLSRCLLRGRLLLLLAAFAGSANATMVNESKVMNNWQEWKTVGKAQLSILFFDVYNSTLLSPNGRYNLSGDVSPHPLALSIEYQRSISQAQLLEATYEQWLKLGYDKGQARLWINELATIFPNVKQGHRLTYITNGQSGLFVYSPSAATSRQLGIINSESLNDAFLSIWLSPKTEYSDLRKDLIGANK